MSLSAHRLLHLGSALDQTRGDDGADGALAVVRDHPDELVALDGRHHEAPVIVARCRHAGLRQPAPALDARARPRLGMLQSRATPAQSSCCNALVRPHSWDPARRKRRHFGVGQGELHTCTARSSAAERGSLALQPLVAHISPCCAARARGLVHQTLAPAWAAGWARAPAQLHRRGIAMAPTGRHASHCSGSVPLTTAPRRTAGFVCILESS